MEEHQNRMIDPQFKDNVSRNLNEFRKSNMLCDTTITAEGKSFAAHRCVLSAASLYFRGLFTTELNESESNRVELKMIRCAALTEVLEFIYTGEAKVDTSNAQDLIMAADYLIIPSLKAKASVCLEKTINASNCLVLGSFASQFNCDSMKQTAVSCACQHFASVVKSEDFKFLDFGHVKNLICQDEIIVSKEEEVYEAVVCWVKHDVGERESFFPELLKCVRLFSMSKFYLWETVSKEELVVKSSECMSIVHRGLNNFLFPDEFHRTLQRPRLCLKTHELVAVLTGGHELEEYTAKSSSDIFGFSLATKQWVSLPRMRHHRSRHAAAVCCGQLYIVGGRKMLPLSYFDPLRNKWFSKNDNAMKYCEGCTLTTLDEELYMIGGKEDNGDILGCCDKYNCKHNKWTELSTMQFPRYAHCAIVLKGLIYIMAGQDSVAPLKSVECYNPSNRNQWTQAAEMICARSFAAATASSGKIIVVGGYADVEFEAIEASCEIFDKSTNQWSLVSTPIVPRAACGIVSVGSCVYLFGGEDANQDLDIVECYSVQEDTWILVGTMPGKRTCLQASLLQLPIEHLQR